jgi:hypothetical protein
MKISLLTLISFAVLSYATITLSGCKGDEDEPEVVGCMDSDAKNYNSKANKDCECCKYQGGVLFYTTDALMIPSCGTIDILVSNGQSTTIAAHYIGTPGNCVNQVGGYLLMETGQYTYEVTGSNGACHSPSGDDVFITGQFTVVEGCNRIRIRV